MTVKQYNEKIEKLMRKMARHKPSKKEIKRQHDALRQLQGIWAANPRTQEDLKRVRSVIWGT